jgi:hypothetical protein
MTASVAGNPMSRELISEVSITLGLMAESILKLKKAHLRSVPALVHPNIRRVLYLRRVPDILITRTSPGVVIARSVDPFSMLEIHRIERSVWDQTPDLPGVYLLYGFVSDRPAVYVGMSRTSIYDRVRTHHVTPKKDWFGTLFAVPMQSAVLCPAVEAEMIRRVSEAGVVTVINVTLTSPLLDDDDVHVTPAVDQITASLEVLLGSDIFSPSTEDADAVSVGTLPEKTPLLARTYKSQAAKPRSRVPTDPPNATHSYVGSQTTAWGCFEGPEPDTRFRVLAGSRFRLPRLDPTQVAYGHQEMVAKWQHELESAGVIDLGNLVFLKDHVFENWTRASKVISGKGTYAGAYHWQLIV